MKYYDKNGMWVIGDVHGCYHVLIELIKKIPKNSEICFVGDLIDRGKNSKDVIELIINNNYHCVLGNHELMWLEQKGQLSGSIFEYNGGNTTIESYENNIELMDKHKKWLQTLSHFEVFKFKNHKDLIVSHSNIIPYFSGYDINDYSKFQKEEIVWNRKITTYNRHTDENFFNIFGHTPRENVDIEKSTAIIDTGCVFGEKLSAIHYPTMEIMEVDFFKI